MAGPLGAAGRRLRRDTASGGGVSWLRGCLACCVEVVAGAVPGAHADASLQEEPARRDAELERVNAGLVVPQRLVSGRSPERARPRARAQAFPPSSWHRHNHDHHGIAAMNLLRLLPARLPHHFRNTYRGMMKPTAPALWPLPA